MLLVLRRSQVDIIQNKQQNQRMNLPTYKIHLK